MTNHNWEDLAALHAVDALDGEELQVFEARLEQDAALGPLVDELRMSASALGASLSEAVPSAGLRERTLARMSGRAANPSKDGAPSRGAGGEAAGQYRSGIAWVPWALAAAFAALSLGLGLSRQDALEQLAQTEADRDTVTEQLATAQEQLATLDSLLAPLHDTDLQFASLEQAADQPAMRMLWSPSRGRLVFAVNRLPSAAPGRTYQLWGIPAGGDPVSLATFDTDEAGNALELRSTMAATSFAASAVTEEPAGGSAQPTTPPFLVGNWGAAGL